MPTHIPALLLATAAGATALVIGAPSSYAADAHTGATTASAAISQSAATGPQQGRLSQTPRAGHGRGHNATYSGNWSGYTARNGTGGDTSVSASWTQPRVSCGSRNTYSSYWVGLDGWSNSALEQTGTEANCVNGRAQYGAWWEVLPANESRYSVTVEPGDQLSASVVDNGDDTFTMTLSDSTQGWTRTTRHAGSSNYQDNSAEVIAEAPTYNNRIADLADFGTVYFTDARANGQSLDANSPFPVTMRNSSTRDILAVPGGLSDGSFAVTWRNSR